jgi:hypothetical protein
MGFVMGEKSSKPLSPALKQVQQAYASAYEFHCLSRGVDIRIPFRSSPRWDSCWAGIHSKVRAAKVPPSLFFEVMFRNLNPGEKCLPPLIEGKNWKWDYAAAAERFKENLRKDLVASRRELARISLLAIAEDSMTEEAAVRRSLRDPDASLSPIFRYCFAAQYGVKGIRPVYQESALREYRVLRPLYDAAWGAFVAKSLRRFVDQEVS